MVLNNRNKSSKFLICLKQSNMQKKITLLHCLPQVPGDIDISLGISLFTFKAVHHFHLKAPQK